MTSVIPTKQTAGKRLMHRCTCVAPLHVDIIGKPLVEGGYEQDDDYKNYCSSSTTNLSKIALLKNLQEYGYSPVRLFSDEIPPPPTREEILKLFHEAKCGTHDTSEEQDVKIHFAESGSSEGTVEPKESLEVQLSKCFTSESNDNNVSQVKTWCRVMSKIAQEICFFLEIPQNTLLNEEMSESLDLLRVFHYYKTPVQDFGSNPHTDWGTLTIIWQDHIGGLQTFCRACEKWNGIKALVQSNKESCWNCIVHVGDMASLALDYSSELSMAKPVSESCCYFTWPSPKHRVVSSTTTERVSLVYFGYPPASKTLSEIQKTLLAWIPIPRGYCLPSKEYYLLHDQSTTKSCDSDDCTESAEGARFHSILNMPVQKIVKIKWNQVNRST